MNTQRAIRSRKTMYDILKRCGCPYACPQSLKTIFVTVLYRHIVKYIFLLKENRYDYSDDIC